MAAIIPTKSNLLAVKRSLVLAKLGYDLMDRKRNILIREMMSMIDQAKEIQAKIDSTFRTAYAALQNANITLGIIEQIALTVPVDDSVVIKFRSVMGVEVPIVRTETEPSKVYYGFSATSSVLDEVYIHFLEVKRFTALLAEVETSVYRLAVAIKKTQKRANALKNIIIPNFNSIVRNISDALEEKDREEFTRLKVIKATKEKEAFLAAQK